MATLAHVMSTVTEVDSDRAAENALPIDVLRTMFFTDSLASTILLQLAFLAQEVFLRSAGLF